jgi:hypothetical protein
MAKKKAPRFTQTPKKKSSRKKKQGFFFVCPSCGRIPREEVLFLCNKCGPGEMVYQKGLYLCPQCFEEGEKNFECSTCRSSKVAMKSYQ